MVFTQVINLDRSPERLSSIAEYLHKAGIDFVRFSAYDGRELDIDNDPLVTDLFDLDMWRRRHHRNPIPADIGCYLSHYYAIAKVLEQDKPYGMVFEDDAVIAEDFVARVGPALAHADDWDILKLHARHPGPLVKRRALGEGSDLCSFVTKHAGATCYLFNHKAAQRMLTHMRPAIRMNDWTYDEAHKMDLRLRTVSPMPVSLQAVASTIEVDRDKSRRSWIERHADRPLLPRWSLPFRRAADDVHRVIFNLFVRWRPQVHTDRTAQHIKNFDFRTLA